jgi:CBS domain-containing membrane protein
VSAVREWLGVELDEVSWKEKAVSAAGGALSIALIVLVCRHMIGLDGAAMIISSMGASAVLVFAAPHGQLSQPWPVLAGHIGSAFIGVMCAELIPNTELAAAGAVGLAIGAMHQLKCIHPPGGATALTAVIGGPAIHSLGFGFIWRPVAVNAVLIVAAGVAFNWFFPWRRYPTVLVARDRQEALDLGDATADALTHDDVMEALRSLDSFVDITEDDLLRLHQLLARRELDALDERTDPAGRPTP